MADVIFSRLRYAYELIFTSAIHCFWQLEFPWNLHIPAALQFSCLWTGKLQILIRSSSRQQFRVVSRRRLSCHKPSRSSNTDCGIAAWFLELTPRAIYMYLKERAQRNYSPLFFLSRMHKNFHHNKYELFKISKFSEFSRRQTSRRLSSRTLKNFVSTISPSVFNY